jgi:hypothetical protein
MTPSKPANTRPPDIASVSIPDTLAALHVNPDTGFTHAEVDVRRKEQGLQLSGRKKSASGPRRVARERCRRGLGALQRYRLEDMCDPRQLMLSSLLVDYPFAKRLYPGSLAVLAHLRPWGATVILSDLVF